MKSLNSHKMTLKQHVLTWSSLSSVFTGGTTAGIIIPIIQSSNNKLDATTRALLYQLGSMITQWWYSNQITNEQYETANNIIKTLLNEVDIKRSEYLNAKIKIDIICKKGGFNKCFVEKRRRNKGEIYA